MLVYRLTIDQQRSNSARLPMWRKAYVGVNYTLHNTRGRGPRSPKLWRPLSTPIPFDQERP